MRSLFPPAPAFLSKAVEPLATKFSLTTLPEHIHEVLLSFIFYHLTLTVISPAVSRLLVPRTYNSLSPRTRINWDVHVVSFVQSTLINGLAFYVMYYDEERKNMSAYERVRGYTGGCGMIQGLATGYFVWDLFVTLQHLSMFGFGMLAHAVGALAVFSFGYRPFVNYYAPTFILYELSSPMLNIHWFFDKMNMTGSTPQLINGILLLATFFSCRLVWGTYSSYLVFRDVWPVLFPSASAPATVFSKTGVMRFTDSGNVPVWVGGVYLASNIVLNGLNAYWFSKMIDAVRKRFVAKPTADGKAKKELDDSNSVLIKKDSSEAETISASGARTITVSDVEVRQRLPASALKTEANGATDEASAARTAETVEQAATGSSDDDWARVERNGTESETGATISSVNHELAKAIDEIPAASV
jgi:hypothetical protein